MNFKFSYIRITAYITRFTELRLLMGRIHAICAALLATVPLLTGCGRTDEVRLSVISYNIRTSAADDGDNSWEHRRQATVDMLIDKHPDIFGVQEAQGFQIGYITDNLPEYKSIGVGRDDGEDAGEHMSIFYDSETVKLLDWGTFWLSETPELPSKGWDAAYPRTATWALMEKDGHRFYYVNTHLDHVGKEAQKNGLALIMDRIAGMNPEGWPMVLTGDFNVTPDDPVLDGLKARMSGARDTAADTDSLGSFNGWGADDRILDYIWYSGFTSCDRFETVRKQYGGVPYISDHYPVSALLTF